MPNITVTETCRAVVVETTTYETNLTVDQIKAVIFTEGNTATIEDIDDREINRWLNENLLPAHFEYEVTDIVDRDWTRVEAD